jgi:predicted transcriptional regulator
MPKKAKEKVDAVPSDLEDDFELDVKTQEEIPSGIENEDTESDFDNSLNKEEESVKNLKIKLEEAKNENAALTEKLKSLNVKSDETIVSALNKLYEKVKDERVSMVLSAFQEDYLKLKYKSHDQVELRKIQERIADGLLKERFEGRIKVAESLAQ